VHVLCKTSALKVSPNRSPSPDYLIPYIHGRPPYLEAIFCTGITPKAVSSDIGLCSLSISTVFVVNSIK